MNDDLRAAALAATPGPWHFGSPFEDGCVRSVPYTWKHRGEPSDNAGTDPPGYFWNRPKERGSLESLHSPSGLVLTEWAAGAEEEGLEVSDADATYISLASPDRILALLDDLRESYEWIVDEPHLRDWACGECDAARDPTEMASDMLKVGFICTWHKARAALAAREDSK